MIFKRKAKRFRERPAQQKKKEAITQHGFGTEMPPQKILVEIYFDQKGYRSLADEFYARYQKAKWCSPKGTPYKNWKLLAGDWIFNYAQEQKLMRRLRENHVAAL